MGRRRALIFALLFTSIVASLLLIVKSQQGSTATSADAIDLRSALVYEAPLPSLHLDSKQSAKFKDTRGTIEKLRSGNFDVNLLFTEKGHMRSGDLHNW